MMKIAFDIDGTLGDHKWLHRELRKFAEQGHDVIVWSGGGVPYAKEYVERNKLPARVVRKCSEEVDLAFDDATEHISGAKITIQVPYRN
jgi:phosphoserine phosphatase